MGESEGGARFMRVQIGALGLAGAGVLYAGWLTFLYSRPRYDTPCGSILGPRAGYFGWDTQGTCGVTHWWTAGLVGYCLVGAAGLAFAALRWPDLIRAVLVLVLAVAVGALLMLVLMTHVSSEPVIGEAWTAARNLLGITLALQAIATLVLTVGPARSQPGSRLL
jgi:hypothetical protein